jgi:MFS family permease
MRGMMQSPSVHSISRLRWIVFAFGAAGFFISFFHRVAPAAIAEDLTRIFDLSGAALGTLAATYFYVYAVMQLPTGVLADTLGPRRVLSAGALVAGIGSILFGAATTWPMAALGRTLAGLGVSVAFVCLLKLNASWFDERRFATATGMANVVGICGALAATAPLAWIITLVSWRAVFVAIGAASLVLAVLTWKVVRDEPPGALHPSHPSARAASGRWYHGLAAVMRNRATWSAFWVNFGISGSYMSFIGLWAVPYLVHSYGFTPLAASRHTSVMLIAFAVSVAGVGALSDRMGRRRPLLIASAVSYCACWGVWFSGAVPAGWTYVLCAFMGFTTTGFTLSWACAKEANPHRYAGMGIAVANTGGFAAAGILQPLVGWVLDLAGGGAGHYAAEDFRAGVAVLALFAAIGLTGALFIRETYCRNISSDSQQKVPAT